MTPKEQVYWYSLRQPETNPLTKNIEVDVAVVGGGMAGLMCAQRAREQGFSVTIIEAAYCGAGASGKSSGFITPDSELELSDLISAYGESQAKKLWEFVTSGCEAIRKNILDNKLECDYQVQDSLFIANTRKGRDKILHEHSARQQLNYSSTLYEAKNIPDIVKSNHYHGAVRYPGTFGIVSYLYCQGLKNVLVKQGVKVYERIPVTQINGHILHCGNYQVTAKNIIVSIDHFLPALGIVPHDVYHAQTFLALSSPLTLSEQKKIFPQDNLMVWDTDLIYQYYRMTGEGRLLLGGSNVLYTYKRQKSHSPQLVIKKLHRYLQTKFPEVDIKLEYFWPGFIGVSKDFLPIAGQHPHLPYVYYIAGAAGLPWAAALGRYMADKIADTKAGELDQYFATPRKYPINYTVQNILGKPITFALSHGITKYFK